MSWRIAAQQHSNRIKKNPRKKDNLGYTYIKNFIAEYDQEKCIMLERNSNIIL